MRSLYKTQSMRDVKYELKRAEAKFTTTHSSSINPILKRKRGPSHCTADTEIANSDIPESTISETSENPGSSSETRGSAQRTTVHLWNHSNMYKRRWKCKRRCLLTTNMLKQDCHEVRRLFQRSDCIINIPVAVPNHDDQQQTRKKGTASDEELRVDHGSIKFLVNESLRLVKNLTLDASPIATSSASKNQPRP